MNPGQKPWTTAEFERKVAWVARSSPGRRRRRRPPGAVAPGRDGGRAREGRAHRHLRPAGHAGHRRPRSSARPSCARGCSAAIRSGSDFPDAVRLESTDPQDPQSPAIPVDIPGSPGRCCTSGSRCATTRRSPRCSSPTSSPSCPPTSTGSPGTTPTPTPTATTATAIGAAISTIRRTAEATALRVLLTEVMKGTETPVIVLGDVNDGQHSNTVNILTEQPRYLVGESRRCGHRALHGADAAGVPRHPRRLLHARPR